MKKLLVIALGLLVAGTVSVNAAKGSKKSMTPEQEKLKKEMVEKYDANKDGKVDEQEAAKIDRADKKKMKEAGVKITSGKRKK
jgi:hypothetical protein